MAIPPQTRAPSKLTASAKTHRTLVSPAKSALGAGKTRRDTMTHIAGSLSSPVRAHSSQTIVGQTRTIMDQTRTIVNQTRTIVDQTRTIMDQTRSIVDQTRTIVDQTRTIVDQTRTGASSRGTCPSVVPARSARTDGH